MDHARGCSLVLLSFLSYGARIAVNIFLMISCWFLCEHAKPAKVLLIWGEVFLYAVVLTSFMALNGNASAKDLISAFFPIIRRPLWYASVYIYLVLIAPLFQPVFKIDRHRFQSILRIGFLAICVTCMLSNLMDTFLDGLIWFIYVFLFVGYYKKYLSSNKIQKEFFLAFAMGIYIFSVISILLGYHTENRVLYQCGRLCNQYVSDYKSIPNVLCAFCTFVYFTKLKMNTNKIINTFASSAFAVYCIHQVPAFHDFLWMSVFRIEAWYTSPLLVPYFIFSTLLLYWACHLIDMARKKWVEPLWIHSKLFVFLEQKINSLY